MKPPICPKCGNEARTAMTQYGVRAFCCDLWSWDCAPLVDAETHEARKAAHESFDRVWKERQMSRGQAYRLLADRMGLTREQCHMKLMDAETARRVPPIAEQLLREFQ
jgi:hypothetical protein